MEKKGGWRVTRWSAGRGVGCDGSSVERERPKHLAVVLGALVEESATVWNCIRQSCCESKVEPWVRGRVEVLRSGRSFARVNNAIAVKVQKPTVDNIVTGLE